MTRGGRFRRINGAGVLLLAAITLLLAAAPASAAYAAACDPHLSQQAASARWSSFADYSDRVLTVEQTVSQDTCTRCLLRVDAVQAGSGVRTLTPMPLELGTVSRSSPGSLQVRYQVPPGINTFVSNLKATCLESAPVAAPQLNIQPAYALADQGCPPGPVPELSGLPLPAEQDYGTRRFVVTLTGADGNPLAGRHVKWSLSNPVMTEFFLTASSNVTDAQGQAYVTVSPPVYPVDIAPYFSKNSTKVTARTDDGSSASALFVYTRCAPPGQAPPWA
jgi:hypothetical protein